MAEQSTEGQTSWVSSPMPRYICHKEVSALQIKDAQRDGRLGGVWEITPMDERYAPFLVSAEWFAKHQPKVGGYYVVYKDGYASYSPMQAFEEGYTLVTP